MKPQFEEILVVTEKYFRHETDFIFATDIYSYIHIFIGKTRKYF